MARFSRRHFIATAGIIATVPLLKGCLGQSAQPQHHHRGELIVLLMLPSLRRLSLERNQK